MSYKCSNCANHEGCFDADVNDMGCEHFRVDQQSDKKLQLVIEIEEETYKLCKSLQKGYYNGIITPIVNGKPLDQVLKDEGETKERIKVLYLCNGKACDSCPHDDCQHTSNVYYAKNFERADDSNIFVEKADEVSE